MLGRLCFGITLGAISALGCGDLGSGEAHGILERRLADASSHSCIWTHVKGDAYIDVDHGGVRECVQELDKAGIAKAGVCRDRDPNGTVCMARAIVPGKGAMLVSDGLAFRCGEFKLLKVVDVENDSGGLAKVTYVREFNDPMMHDITHCLTTTLHRPEEGQHTKTMYFKRNDGRWDVRDEPAGWLY